ncbi:MAG: hypothetical protein FJ314_09240 [SAR202 cluster bacterium]|nr:hypothetical protein [SAR202 cluster bacterium]
MRLTGWLVVVAAALLITSLVVRNLFLPIALAGVALLLTGYWLAMRSRSGSETARIRRLSDIITAPRLLTVALGLLVVGLAVRRWLVFFAALAFLLFIWAYWIAWPKTTRSGSRWRGEAVETEGFLARLRRWLRGR